MNAYTRVTPLPDFVERADLVSVFAAEVRRQGVEPERMKRMRMGTIGQCQVIAAEEDGRWHLSISHPWRLPSWDEINAARDACIPPQIWLCQPMPPKQFWVNLHPYCLHLWEVRDRDLIAQWATDGGAASGDAVADTFLSQRTQNPTGT